MKLFDSHCHLDDPSFKKDLDRVINTANTVGVNSMMIAGINEKSCQRAVTLAEGYKGLYVAVGVHPHDAKKCNEDMLLSLCTMAKSSKVKAWGEIGLDFNRMYSPQENQEKWFIRQLETADELNLPIIFHERDSKGRLLEILEKHTSNSRKGVIHCFSGNIKELKRYIDLGLYIGITGIITMKKRGESLKKIVPFIPDNRLLIETDAPYLTPAPERNKTRRNEPAFVKAVLLKLSEIKEKEPKELAEIIWDNTCGLFRI